MPELKPQQLDAQSASLVQAPVMNCVPGATAGAAEVPVLLEVAGGGVEAAWPARNFCAAMSLGWASPNPQPPSRSCAMTGPAHLPLLKPQQLDAQSASLWHGPVSGGGGVCHHLQEGAAFLCGDTGCQQRQQQQQQQRRRQRLGLGQACMHAVGARQG